MPEQQPTKPGIGRGGPLLVHSLTRTTAPFGERDVRLFSLLIRAMVRYWGKGSYLQYNRYKTYREYKKYKNFAC